MAQRRCAGRSVDASNDTGDGIAAIARSWAALTHLAIPPGLVFHPLGCRGPSAWFIEMFSAGPCPGLPLLQ